LNFNKATQLRPDSAVCWYWYGIAIAATGYPKEALFALDKALEIQPVSPYTLVAKGNVLRQLGQREAATDSYNAALEQNCLLEKTTRRSLYQEYQPLHHRSNLSLNLLFNPMHKLNVLDFKLTAKEIDYRTEGKAWFYSLGPDLYIFSDLESLDSKHLDAAEDVLAQLEELETESIAYLEKFLDRTHIGAYGDCSLVAVLCNFVAARLELQMNFEYDPHGLWFVEFHRQTSGAWSPLSFGRSSW
jgi:tetratricopeptide (TPR) repeat protein